MFGAQQLMKSSAIFVNTSRGKVVNEPDLIEALKERRIAGAALDVQATEPPPADSPLLKLENVIVTPHIGSWTRETQGYCQRLVEEEVIRFAGGPGGPARELVGQSPRLASGRGSHTNRTSSQGVV